MKQEKMYYVWITLLSNAYVEPFFGSLIKRGWRVGALANTLIQSNDDNVATFVAFSMAREQSGEFNEMSVKTILQEVCDALNVLKAKYYSLTVTEPAGCTWVLGNVLLSEAKRAEEDRKKVTN
jgi:hypothetical protein